MPGTASLIARQIVEVGRAGIFRVDAALHADFGGAALPGLLDPPLDLREVEVIRPAAQIFAELALREGAELAAEITDIGVVDVAGHDIADDVAIDPLPQLVGRPAHRIECLTARRKEPHDIGFAERLSSGRPVEDAASMPSPASLRGHPLPAVRERGCPRLLPRPACGERVRGWRVRAGRFDAGAGDPIVGAREPLGVD